ncbi:FliM/FliN family flagellar motor switch protein [Superficieibacter sp.]|uniref:FliM/FliN family flagellar motor switch protein n=1 Tax=Superficieibacter sp. TaxID=2303322 RepID=UPI0028AAE29F|nr:FliM/FliN family flagellar motor switch protein [Superficieibacter sp.]
MSHHEDLDLLEQGFELADTGETKEIKNSAVAAKDKTPAKSAPLADSMSLLKRIPVTLTLEVSSVEVMLADLLNIDDDTVIELNKLAGEPLDIKVNNILLGKAEVVVVNEKYGLRVIEFNTRDINELTQ